MKCHGCSTQMILDKQETGTGSRTQWHSCPCCGKVRLTSEPSDLDNNLNQTHRQNASHGQVSDMTPNITVTRKGTPYFA